MIRHLWRQPATWVGVLLALGVLAAPLPFGGVVPAARLALEMIGFASLAVAAWALGWERRPPVTVPALLLATLGALAWLQGAAWPAALVEVVSPEHGRLARQAAAVLPAGVEPPPPSLSVTPALSRRQGLGLLALAAAFYAATLAGRHRWPRRFLVAAVIGGGLFQVLYGARRWLERAQTIWGVEVPGIASRLRGTYVNANHLATYLAMALAVAVAWLWWAGHRARREVSAEARLLWLAPPALVALVLLTGLVFTASRAGLLATVLSLAVMGFLALDPEARAGAPRRRRRRARRWRRIWRWGAVPVLLASALGLVGSIGWEEAFGRVTRTGLYEVGWGARSQAYRATVDLWRKFPWTGSGWGSFREAFPMVQPAGLPGTWNHAHSDPLELLATAGLLGLVLVITGVVLTSLRLWRVWRRGWHSEGRAAALAGIGILVALAVQESLDFGLTQPANGFAAAVLLGAACGPPVTAGTRRTSPASTRPPATDSSSKR